MSTKGRENWEKYKAGYVSTRLAEEVSTGNAGRDRWNELKKTIRFDKPESTQNVVSGSGAQKDKKSFLQRAGLTVSGGAKGSLAGNMDAMGVAYELGQSGRTQRYTEELREAQWAVARAKHDYDADPNNWQTKDALDTAIAKMKGFADTLGKGAYEQALTAAYDAASKFETGDLKALYNGLGVVDPEQGTGVQQQAASAARDLAYGVQESASKDLQEAKEGASKFGQMLVDAGASMTQMGIDSAVSGLMGFRPTKWNGGNKILQEALGIGEKVMTPGAMIPFAARAFGGSTMDARQDGADLKGQVLYGGAQAAKEVFTEKMFNIALPFAKAYGKGGLDSVVENGIRKAAEKLGKSDVGRAALERVLKFGASAASEGLEEFLGDFFEWQMPRIYGGDTDSFAETFSNALYDFAVGTISGAAGGAVEGGVDLYNDHAQARETKKIFGDQAQDIVNKSKELAPDNKLAEKYQKKLDKGGKLTGFQLMRIMQQNENGIVEQDKQKIQTAAEARLTELGETENVPQVAEAIARQAAGERITDAEKTLLEGSERARQVRQELNPENIRVGATDEEWTGQIGTARVNRAAYNRGIQENGVTGAKYNAETGKLDAIVKDDQGKIKTVPAEKAELSPLQEELFDWATDLGEAGPVLVSAYRQTQNLETYARQFHNAFEYGKAGVPMDYVNKSQAVSYLNTTQREIAYEEGAKAHQRDLQGRQEKKRSGGTVDSSTQKKPTVSLRGATVGGVTYAPVNKKAMDGRQWASVGTMKAFAQATGVNVVFYESQANERGEYEGANGFYKNGTLYLDINAGRDRVAMGETAILKTAAHEITHYIKEGSPEQYEVLKNFVVEKLTREKGLSIDDLVTDKQRREPGLSYEEAVDEVVADACEMMLKDSKAVEQLARENRSLAERIRQWIRKWVRSLKAAMEGLTADRPESRAMMQYAEELQKIWDDALVDAARNNRGTVQENSPAESKQSIRETNDGKKYVKADRQVLFGSDPDSWSEQLEDYINGKIRRGQDVQLIAEDGDVIILTSTSAGKLSDNHTSDGRTMSDAAFERKANAAAHIDELVEVSSKGKKTVIDKDARHGDMASGGWNYRTAYFMDFDGKYYKTTISVAEGAGGSIVYNVGKMQERSTPQIGGSSGKAGALRGNASNERLSTRRTLHADDTQSTGGELGNAQPSVNSIRQSNDNSQEKSSDKVQNSARDSAGRELTKAQQEYFKDSKVRDTDGNLLVMYHQTDGTFTVFDTKHKGAGAGDDETPFGIFLKRTSRNIGVRGEKQMELYADIRNPLRVRDRTELVSKLRELSVDYARLKDESAQIDKEYGAKFEEAKNAFKSFLIQWRKNNPDAPPRAAYDADGFDAAFNAEDNVVKEWTRAKDELALRAKTSITQALRDNGYDGVILENDKGSWGRSTDAYIALDANQVKNTTNKTPTADPDIRYQQRDNLKEEYHLTDDEESAIISYKSGDSYSLNGKLTARAELTEYQKKLRDNLDAALEKLPVYRGEVYRHYNFEDFGGFEAMRDFLSLFKNGRHIELGGYLSCSIMRNEDRTKGKYTVNMVIQSENGRRLAGFGRNTENEILLPRNTRLVPYQMERMGPTSIRIYVREETISETGKANDSTLPGVLQVREGTQRGKDLQQVSRGDPGKVQSEMGRFAGRDGNRGGMPGLREGEGSRSMDPSGVAENYGRTGTRGGEGEKIKSQQRDPRLSDRAVLEWAAEMALRDKNKSWTAEDREQLERFRNRMRMLQDTQAELEALKEERKVLLAGRKISEITGEERTEVSKNKNRIDIAKNKAERYEAAVWELESKAAIKTLLKKSRSIVEAEAAYKARREYIERREEQEMMAVTRRKVERTAKRLTEYMTTNTDKKHIPEALKKPIGELLESLDFSAKKSGRTTRADLKYIEAMQDLQAALAAQRLFDDTGEGTDLFKGYMDLPAGFESLLAVHVEKVKNALEKHPLKTGLVRAMDIDDLKELDVILSVMSRSVTRMNEMFVNRRFALVSEAAENSIDTMSELGQHQDKTGERFMLWDNTLPWYAFQRFGEGGKAVFEGLQDGWDKLAFNMKTVLDFRKDLIKDSLARKWDTEKHRVELTDPDGATVTAVLTTAQLMSLHCLSKRKQALGHLLGGGIRPSAIELTDSIGDRIKKRSLNQDKQFKLTEESLAHLLGLLTPEQVKIADAMQKFMTEQGSLWGNEVTMIRFGYRGFTEQNYFPIETDAQDRQAKTGDTKDGSLYRLQNISAVKPLVKNANNALVLRGIFDVFANHTADMAKYNALVLPILDAQKWYNYKYASKNEAGQVSTRTVQRAMTKAYGGAANNYVIKYLQDLNGVKESGDRGDTLAKKMISNYKRAMVAANMRVALLQPTAYARASAVLDYEYLAKAFADKTSTKQATAEMLQHSGIAIWKSLGFFDTDVGRSIRDQIKGKSSKLENIVDKTMVPAEKGDEITWARLWRACKLEVRDKQKLTGDELLKATAERFREVIYRTQVVDSTMTRSHTMRSNGTLSKMATSFMSEPTVSYNMVMESTRQTVGDAKRLGMRVAIRRNWKALGRSLQAYVMSAAVTAIVESLYDALRDPDDDEYMEKVWKAFGGEKPETAKDQVLSIIFGLNGNFAGGINPIGKVPYLRDVVSIIGGYSNGRMDTEAVANLKKAIDIWDEVIRLQTGDLDKATKTTYYGNMTTYGMIYPTAKALSQLTGLPGSAAMREVTTAWNTTVGTVWPALKMRTYEDKKLREAWENYGKDSGVSYAVMYRAIQDLKEFESDRDADGNAISGSLKAKYVEYIRGMGLTRAQEKAVWEAAKNSSWSDKGTPWG